MTVFTVSDTTYCIFDGATSTVGGCICSSYSSLSLILLSSCSSLPFFSFHLLLHLLLFLFHLLLSPLLTSSLFLSLVYLPVCFLFVWGQKQPGQHFFISSILHKPLLCFAAAAYFPSSSHFSLNSCRIIKVACDVFWPHNKSCVGYERAANEMIVPWLWEEQRDADDMENKRSLSHGVRREEAGWWMPCASLSWGASSHWCAHAAKKAPAALFIFIYLFVCQTTLQLRSSALSSFNDLKCNLTFLTQRYKRGHKGALLTPKHMDLSHSRTQKASSFHSSLWWFMQFHAVTASNCSQGSTTFVNRGINKWNNQGILIHCEWQ